LLKLGYQPKNFWNKWSSTYFSQHYRKEYDQSHDWLLSTVRELCPSKILEIGCGFGRNLKLISSNTVLPVALSGSDISEEMLKKAALYLNNGDKYRKVNLTCADILKLPYKDGAFDLVFTYGTLMHVSQDNLSKAIGELKRISRKYIISIEEVLWHEENGRKRSARLNDYTFIHNYRGAILNSGLSIKKTRKINGLIDLICICSQKDDS
jgi:ubiquinone/menaquinone biosynthesis C-methylase UbiE